MADQNQQSIADCIVPLNMNGLQGRMLHIKGPANKKREILFIYGHHSTLERWWGAAKYLSTYGNVTVPDLPGFGGMQSLYKIGEKPTLDTMADYLAAFVKLRYARKRVTIIGMSYGFLVATRMLQRYPEITKKVDLLMSAAGFAHHDDFVFSRRRFFVYRALSKFLSWPPASIFFHNVCLHPSILRAVYSKSHNAKHKFANLDKQAHRRMMDFEVDLWHVNDVRTHWATTYTMLKVDNCQKQVNLPVHHVAVSGDQYFDKHRVEQHLRVIFSSFDQQTAHMTAHAPSVLADERDAAQLFPPKYRRLLAKNP